MSSVIPPEFFGLYGLGSALNMFGEAERARREEQRRKDLQEVQLMLALAPNRRQEILAQVEKIGLLEPGAVTYEPTFEEQKSDILSTFARTQQFPTGDFAQGVVSQELNIPFGQTPTQAREQQTSATQLAASQARLAGLEESAAEFERTKREQVVAALRDPKIRKALNLPPEIDLNPGSLEVWQTLSSLRTEQLNQAYLILRTDSERQRLLPELDLLRAQIASLGVETEIKRAQLLALRRARTGLSEADEKWLMSVSEGIGHVAAASEIYDVLRARQAGGALNERQQFVAGMVDRFQQNARHTLHRTESMKALEFMMQAYKNGHLQLDERGAAQMERLFVEALREARIPAHMAPGVKRSRFGVDILARDTPPYVQLFEDLEEIVNDTRSAGGESATISETGETARVTPQAAAELIAIAKQRGLSAETMWDLTKSNTELNEDDRRAIWTEIEKAWPGVVPPPPTIKREPAVAPPSATTPTPPAATTAPPPAAAPTSTPTTARPTTPPATQTPTWNPPTTRGELVTRVSAANAAYAEHRPGRQSGSFYELKRLEKLEAREVTLREREEQYLATINRIPQQVVVERRNMDKSIADSRQRLTAELRREEEAAARRAAATRQRQSR